MTNQVNAIKAKQLLLIQFAKAPIPGRVKTRLLPVLDAPAAAQLHADLVFKTWQTLVGAELGAIELWVDKEPQHPLFSRCLAIGGTGPRLQQGTDLGERMAHALEDGLKRYRGVILVGSDCPGIDRRYLQQAKRLLTDHPVVLGPALDGGYVLVGLTQFAADLFRNIPWGSDCVFEETVSVIKSLGWRWGSLPPQRDIDEPEDLVFLTDYPPLR